MFARVPLVCEPPGPIGFVSELAARCVRQWGLPPATLVRLSANAVFVAGPAIIRISRMTAEPSVAVALSEHLAATGIRVPRALDRQPIVFEHDEVQQRWLVATAWQRIIPSGAPVEWASVGAMVARLHRLDPAAIAAPLPFGGDYPWWQFERLLGDLPGTERTVLQPAFDELRWWYGAARQRPLVVCHGDVHPGNVIADEDGPVLLDWDLLCLAPPCWDHAPLITWHERWGGDAQTYPNFCRGYGAVCDDPLAEAMARLRLLAATIMRLRAAALHPDDEAITTEAQRRLAYWRGDPTAPTWTAV